MPRALFIGGDHDGRIIDVPEYSERHNMPYPLEHDNTGTPWDGWQTYHRRYFPDDHGGTVFVYVHGRIDIIEIIRRAMEFAEVPPFLLKG